MVSIHAPTRGATLPVQPGRRGNRVSIHAPTRGATSAPVVWILPVRRFNPRPHAGGDLSFALLKMGSIMFQSTPPRGGRPRSSSSSWMNIRVSIHAPTRGATAPRSSLSKRSLFQSTPPRGGRLGIFPASLTVSMFQSTPPRGGRHTVHRVTTVDLLVSIHAPTRGATGRTVSRGELKRVSIHAPTRGATWFRAVVFRLWGVSIHAPTRGATSHSARSVAPEMGFNPRPHAGGDVRSDTTNVSWLVSIHAPTRGATQCCCHTSAAG